MSISLIVAHDEDFAIGRDGALPWRLPNDLQQFKRLTLDKTILMGRKTWESLPRRPLPGRDNWVLTRDSAYQAPGARVFTSVADAFNAHPDGELMVIGGADLYRQALPFAQRLYVTQVHACIGGDAHFPAYQLADYRVTEQVDCSADPQHAHAYSFLTLERSGARQGDLANC